MQQIEAVIGTVPLIGDGNPATLLARHNLHKQELPEIPFHILHPVAASVLARQLHKIMTLSERLRELYTTSGEESIRGSAAGKILGALFYHSLVSQLLKLPDFANKAELQLTLVQEHLLYGAEPWQLAQLFTDSQLLIPDSRPKRSAITALQQHAQVTAVTWNCDTFELLHNQRVSNTRLAQPELVAGHTSTSEQENLHKRGVPIVVKGSGSGMPRELQRQILAALQAQKLAWKFHLPHAAFSGTNGFETMQTFQSRAERLHDFYASLGGKTKLLITYPNEQTQAIAELAAQGCCPQVLLLPPRGEHEVHNISFLLKHYPHLIRGVILRKEQSHYGWAQAFADRLTYLSIDELPEVLKSI